MSYTRIRELPSGGPPIPVDAQNHVLVLEQDVTRQVSAFTFLSNYIAPLTVASQVVNTDRFLVTGNDNISRNVTMDNVMNYVNTHLNQVANTFYVSLSGVDSLDVAERGKNIQLPFRTIKFAAQQIKILQDTTDINEGNSVNDPTVTNRPKQWSIIVSSGDYLENNPIYLPPNTSLIGDNLRRTSISPLNIDQDIIWVNSACYIWGFTFRGHRVQSEIILSGYDYDSNGYYSSAAYADIASRVPPAAVAFPLNTQNASRNLTAYYLAYYGVPVLGNESPLFNIPVGRIDIKVSPYVQGCTSYALPTPIAVQGTPSSALFPNGDDNNINDAGAGMRIDGSLVTGKFRSMVLDSFTQVNQGGRGIHILNHGYAQLVSIFTVSTYEGIICEGGGSCSISTSNSTFGLSGLIGRGMSGATYYPPIQYNVDGTMANSDVYYKLHTGQNQTGIPAATPILSGIFTIMPRDAIQDLNTNTGYNYTWGYSSGGDLFTIKDVGPVPYPRGDANPDIIATIPYTNLCFTVQVSGNTASCEDFIMESDVDATLPNNNRPKLFTVDLPVVKNNYTVTSDDKNPVTYPTPTTINNLNNPNAYDIQLTYNTPYWDLTNLNNNRNSGSKDFTNGIVYFYARSMVETGSHTFEYMGTGTRMVSSVPAYGGVAINNNEAVFDGLYDTNAPGIVYYTSSNELGNFKVGPNFTIVQSTGTIEGDTFKRAIMTLVTPLNLVLE